MNSAQLIIQKFGGQSALAAALGKGQTTVQHWGKTGRIPAKWQPVLLRLAMERSLDLSASDFMPPAGYTPIVVDSGKPKIPEAKWWGDLTLGDAELPVYVLDNGMRVISRTGATGILTDRKGGGNLESYLHIGALQKCIPPDLPGLMVEFQLKEVV